jgi:hypothetical protein
MSANSIWPEAKQLPVRAFIRVVFPLPEFPTIASICPLSTTKEIPFSTGFPDR